MQMSGWAVAVPTSLKTELLCKGTQIMNVAVSESGQIVEEKRCASISELCFLTLYVP